MERSATNLLTQKDRLFATARTAVKFLVLSLLHGGEVWRSNVEISKGNPATYAAKNGTIWSCCSNCGTTLFWKPKEDGPFTITIGSLDDPSDFPPTSTTYDEDRIPREPHQIGNKE